MMPSCIQRRRPGATRPPRLCYRANEPSRAVRGTYVHTHHHSRASIRVFAAVLPYVLPPADRIGCVINRGAATFSAVFCYYVRPCGDRACPPGGGGAAKVRLSVSKVTRSLRSGCARSMARMAPSPARAMRNTRTCSSAPHPRTNAHIPRTVMRALRARLRQRRRAHWRRCSRPESVTRSWHEMSSSSSDCTPPSPRRSSSSRLEAMPASPR
mmetsp:Transcript_24179/g.52769  ORF Transcript_24179/g.52769 Transcript_24179/m.52769 type:complete len:212 (+) Transcript_24179:69-704(+)